MLRFADYMTMAQDGGKVVSLMHQPPLPPGNTPGTHFCYMYCTIPLISSRKQSLLTDYCQNIKKRNKFNPDIS
jgi:hypothetical protein